MKIKLSYEEKEWLVDVILKILAIAEETDRLTHINPTPELWSQIGDYFDKNRGDVDYYVAIHRLIDSLPRDQNFIVLNEEEGFGYDSMKLTWFRGANSELLIDVVGHDTVDFLDFVKDVREMIKRS
jgi:hypothetical protein